MIDSEYNLSPTVNTFGLCVPRRRRTNMHTSIETNATNSSQFNDAMTPVVFAFRMRITSLSLFKLSFFLFLYGCVGFLFGKTPSLVLSAWCLFICSSGGGGRLGNIFFACKLDSKCASVSKRPFAPYYLIYCRTKWYIIRDSRSGTFCWKIIIIGEQPILLYLLCMQIKMDACMYNMYTYF